MSQSNQGPDRPVQQITEEDIESRDLKRRSFLKGMGLFTGAAVLGIAAVGCNDDPVTNESDPVDEDPTDDFDTD